MESKVPFVILGILAALAVPVLLLICVPGVPGGDGDIDTGSGARGGDPPDALPTGTDSPAATPPATEPGGSSKSPVTPEAEGKPGTVGELVEALLAAHRKGRPAEMQRIYGEIRARGAGAIEGLKEILKGDGDPRLKLFAINALGGLKASGEDGCKYNGGKQDS